MKKLILFLFTLSFTLFAQSQVSKSINLTAAGTLSTLLSTSELNIVTNLTVTGNVNTCDFKTMRDNMPFLSVLDIKNVNILAYTGNGGTSPIDISYPANGVPQYSFGFINNNGKQTLKSVTLPSSITSIGEFAFETCGLTSLTIPNSVISIGKSAFYNNSNLTSLTIPNSVTSIGESAFWNCQGLTSLAIPNSVTSIGKSAFWGCSGLTSLTIPNSVTSIGDYAFQSCTSLTGSILIPSSTTSIGNGTFTNCTKITSFIVQLGNKRYLSNNNLVYSLNQDTIIMCPNGYIGNIVIPNSVTSIGNRAFQNCNLFKGNFTIPNSVTSIGDFAFTQCSGLTSITIPNSVISIGEYAFINCTSLTGTLNIPNSVTSIGDGAFKYCTSLTGSILIPSPTTSIGNGIFSYCTKLTSFIVQSGNKRYSSYNNLIYSLNQDTIIMCPNGYVGNIVIPNSVTSIANNAFEGCSLLTGNLTIPNSVTSIGEYAFAGFSSVIGTLLIPNAITSIANHAFEGCSSLNGNLTIPNSVTSIGFGAFADCQGLTSITIPNSVTTIDTLAFAFCFGLSSIYANSTIPINLNSSPDVFYYDNKTLTGNDKTVTLYVPVGSKSAYQVANQWSDFQNIVEFSPSAIDNPSSSKLTVSLQNGQLQLNGATVGDELSIYTLQGTIAYNQKVDQETIKLHFHAHGVFIVSVGIQSIKVVN